MKYFAWILIFTLFLANSQVDAWFWWRWHRPAPRPAHHHNPCNNRNACGNGANCENRGGRAACICRGLEVPEGQTCCHREFKTFCWGDPHCTSWDGVAFDFMGRCTYIAATTNCPVGPLPSHLTPFEVIQKQERRNGPPNWRHAALLQYLELRVHGRTYRLTKGRHLFVNGAHVGTPFQDHHGVKGSIVGKYLMVGTNFGLRIFFDGDQVSEMFLCDSYRGRVCGLFGNANGNGGDDFQNPQGHNVPLHGDHWTRYYKWGTSWRSGHDNDIDVTGQHCNSNLPPRQPQGPRCHRLEEFKQTNWCGALSNRSGPWGECLRHLDSATINGLVQGCLFDMCASEGSHLLLKYRCAAFEKLNGVCLNLGARKGFRDWNFNWRVPTGCHQSCAHDEIFATRRECPRTCLDPEGRNFCGITSPREGCYCRDGFVRNSAGRCIRPDECGCRKPDGTGLLGVGRSTVSIDCSAMYSCDGPQQNARIEHLRRCSPFASCRGDSNGQRKCQCNQRFEGDGFNCRQIVVPPPPNPCATPGVCGRGAICHNNNGVAQCLCSGRVVDKRHVCCNRWFDCGCSGDPHCHSFDRYNSHPQGRCTYEMISTYCRGSVLPNDLVPFRVLQKHWSFNNVGQVSFVGGSHLHAYGNVYSITREIAAVNNIWINLPYNDAHGVEITGQHGVYYSLHAKGLGLYIIINLRQLTSTYYLCSHYARHVCGLCGNADGNRNNDIVNRDGVRVPTPGSWITAYYRWVSSWKYGKDNTIDMDGKRCNSNSGGILPNPGECKQKSIFEGPAWCGLIRDRSGPWSECLQRLPEQQIKAAYEECVMDLCIAEDNEKDLKRLRCVSYNTMNTACLNFAAKNGLRDWHFNWRQNTQCTINCSQNEIFAVRRECPRTCLDPEGRNFCGIISPREGCYCRDGFVRNSAGRCIRPEECGCRRPDGRGLVGVGQSVITVDCRKRYTCDGPQQNVRVEHLRGCGANAQCRGDASGQPRCFCNNGFIGDGINCQAIQTIPPANPCARRGICGRGTVCQNNNGNAVCLCNGRVIPHRQRCCNREFRTLY